MFFQSLIIKIIKVLIKLIHRDAHIKLLPEYNQFEPGYRDNAIIVKEIKEEVIKQPNFIMEYIVHDNYSYCPICKEFTQRHWQCRPDNRLSLNHLKKRWHKAPTCAAVGIHYHCLCGVCGCRWVVPIHLKTQQIQLD